MTLAGQEHTRALRPGARRQLQRRLEGELLHAVTLILDASCSMLQRMEGVRYIDIAKRGLIEAVSRHIAPGTPVALRVFGHRQPNACRADLDWSRASEKTFCNAGLSTMHDRP